MGLTLTKANETAGVRLSKISYGDTAITLSDSRTESTSLAKFLTERHLLAADDTYEIERARGEVEASGIVNMMLETCTSINKMVGRTIIDVHSFLPPEPILCCFIYVEGGTEYFLRLELQGAIPTLSFSERNCRDTVTNDFIRWIHRLANIEPVTITVKLVHEFQDLSVSVEQVGEWFKYLVSGLDRSYVPRFY